VLARGASQERHPGHADRPRRPLRTFSDRKLIAVDIAQTIVAMLELPDRAFITETAVWATNPE